MACKKDKDTELSVFRGKAAKLNRVILRVLERQSPLNAYDVWRSVKSCKGFKHENSKTVYRRIDALHKESWIRQKGTRPAKVQGESRLYELTLKGKAALKLGEESIEEFLSTATEEQLAKFIALWR